MTLRHSYQQETIATYTSPQNSRHVYLDGTLHHTGHGRRLTWATGLQGNLLNADHSGSGVNARNALRVTQHIWRHLHTFLGTSLALKLGLLYIGPRESMIGLITGDFGGHSLGFNIINGPLTLSVQQGP